MTLLQGHEPQPAIRHRLGPNGGLPAADLPAHSGTPARPATRQSGPHLTAGATDTRVSVDPARCVGCLACATVCRSDVLRRRPDVWVVTADAERCTGCRRCVNACPLDAITVNGPTRNRRQLVVDALRSSLASTCPRGWTVVSGTPRFQAGPGAEVLIPDLAVLRTPGPGTEWLGPDDVRVPLVVDVLSSAARPETINARHQVYWRAGVPTCWTVDQRTGYVTVQWSARPDWYDRWAGYAFP